MKQSFIQTYCSDNHVFTDGEPHVLVPSYCRLNTAVPILQLYSDEAADHRVHLHLSLLSIPHCCSQTESDHGWERDIEAIIA